MSALGALAGARRVQAALFGAIALTQVAGAPAALNAVTTSFPEDTGRFADGPGAEQMNGNCLACHSAEMVLTQPPLPRAAWEAEVAKMRTVFKAPVGDADVAAIVDYLTRIRGR